MPAEPSDDGFRLGLRSGIILCNVLNKVQPGSVTKVRLTGHLDLVTVFMYLSQYVEENFWFRVFYFR